MKLFIRTAILCLLFISSVAFGGTWDDLWWRKDQQAKHLLDKGHPAEAANLFESQPWQAVSNYRAKKYDQAQAEWMQNQDATSKYNLGNALALQGYYEEAIAAYDEALKINPNLQDAIYNRDLIKKMLKKQPKPKSNPKNQDKNTKSPPKDEKKPSKDEKKDSPDSPSKDQSEDQKKDDQGKESKKNDQKNNNSQNKESSEGSNPSDANPPQPSSQNKESSSGLDQPDSHPPQDSSQNKEPTVIKQKSEKPNIASSQENINKGSASEKEGQPPKAQSDELNQQQKQLDQDTDQWLQQIPDNPAGLLQRKIMRDHLRNRGM